TDFEYAKQVLEAKNPHLTIQPVIGNYYGKTEAHMTENGIFKVYGQDFWYFISDDSDPNLYTKIVEPIGYEAQEHRYGFAEVKSNRINLLFYEFAQQFCLPNGAIDWEKLIQFNSKNLPSPS
ncbi:MAG TPA: PmeII family type II restriction endonuclease, partial [Aggregatilineales bacterium]|nr:PmeII family type II restriction endonuclease [Aggregatilineales bacterium]